MAKTRPIMVRVPPKEYARYVDLAKLLEVSLSEMGREALLERMEVWERRSRSLNPG
jgi:hypothetical protein